MHTLVNAFIEKKPAMPNETEEGGQIFPVKLILGRQKARKIFFKD